MSRTFTAEELKPLQMSEEVLEQLMMDLDENPDIINNADFPQILVIIDGSVLDLRKFVSKHPGGPHAILQYAGKDATGPFNSLHSGRAKQSAKQFVIGTISAGPKP